MSREVRRVPMDYQHPRCLVPDYQHGGLRVAFVPLFPGERYEESLTEFRADPADWDFEPPRFEDYMPVFAGDDLGYCMYETVSEGTPISPVFATPEELARWLADTGASAFGGATATYEQWLHTCRGGYAPSMVFTVQDGLRTGVEALADEASS